MDDPQSRPPAADATGPDDPNAEGATSGAGVTDIDESLGVTLSWPSDEHFGRVESFPPPPVAADVGGTEAEAAPDDDTAEGVPSWPEPPPIATTLPSPGPGLLTVIAERLETMRDQLTAVSMRVDALNLSNSANRGSVSDRIDENFDLVASLLRTQTHSINEYQRINDRAIGELRRASADSAAESSQVLTFVEQISSRLDQLSSVVNRPPVPIVDSPTLVQSIVGAVTAAIDGLRHDLAVLGPELSAMKGQLAGLADPTPTDSDEMAASIARGVKESIDDIRPELSLLKDLAGALADLGPDLSAMKGQLRTLADPAPPFDPDALVPPIVGAVMASVDDIRIDIAALKSEVADVASAVYQRADGRDDVSSSVVREVVDEVRAELEAVREELVALRRRVGLRGRPPVDDATADAVAERVERLLDAFEPVSPPARTALDDEVVTRIADEVLAKFRTAFEVVGDAEEPAPQPSPPAPSSGAAQPRKSSQASAKATQASPRTKRK